MNIKEAKELLKSTNLFFDADDLDEEEEGFDKWVLNMNDVWCWACADCEEVKEEDLPELARLFSDYGWCGILYWVSEKNNKCKSEFLDNSRFIDFVRNEETLKVKVPNSNERAYTKLKYTLGK